MSQYVSDAVIIMKFGEYAPTIKPLHLCLLVISIYFQCSIDSLKCILVTCPISTRNFHFIFYEIRFCIFIILRAILMTVSVVFIVLY